MGIYDRDYARVDNPAAVGGSLGGRRAGPPGKNSWLPPGAFNIGRWSVTTWLIVINIAIFVLGAAILQRPGMLVRVPWGTEHFSGTMPEAVKRGQVITAVTEPHPTKPGVLFHPIVDPQTPALNEAGRTLVDQFGRVIPSIIGRQRFSMRPADEAYGHFSTGKGFFELQVWRLVTFQFLHVGPVHLALNMLGLFMFGGMVESVMGRKRYLAFYLACGIFGAVMYLLLNLVGNLALPMGIRLPGLLFDDLYTPLVGASAGIFGVLLAAAYISPDERVLVLFVLPMRLQHVVYIFVAIALISLIFGASNAGGEAAHVGGALAGAFFIRRSHLLGDFFDVWGRTSSGASKSPHRPNVRLVRPPLGERSIAPAVSAKLAASAEAALDKVARSGRASLTEAELATLEQYRLALQQPKA